MLQVPDHDGAVERFARFRVARRNLHLKKSVPKRDDSMVSGKQDCIRMPRGEEVDKLYL